MTDWLIDTNVLSELRRDRPSRRVTDFVAAQPLDSMFVSVVTFAELRFGIERLDDLDKRADLSLWLESRIRPKFQGRILPVSEDVMLTWRILVDRGRKARHTFTQPDLILAATALHFGLTVVTRDVVDFERAGAAVFNPWS